MSDNCIRVVELFAGVGGFRVGLDRVPNSPYKTIWANQWEPGKKVQHAFNCYVKNFGASPNHVNKDIATVIDEVPEHDMLVGGFPCQDYSVARTGAKGIEGKKGVLWWYINEILEKRHPKYVLLENVDRLLKSPASQRGRDFGIILYCLNKLGYAVEWRVVNAADYGNAQRRRRTLILAYAPGTSLYDTLASQKDSNLLLPEWIQRDGLMAKAFPIQQAFKRNMTTSLNGCSDLVEVTRTFKALFNNAGVMIHGKIFSAEVIPDARPKFAPMTLASICEQQGVAEKYFLSPEKLEKWRYLKGAKKIERIRPNGEPYVFAEGGIPFPDVMDRPSRTMLTSESSLNRSTHVVIDPETKRYRLLTPIECERLNGFADNWTKSIPERARYFTMGNALVVPLITRIGKALRSWPDSDDAPVRSSPEKAKPAAVKKTASVRRAKTQDAWENCIQLCFDFCEPNDTPPYEGSALPSADMAVTDRLPLYRVNDSEAPETLLGTYDNGCRQWIVEHGMFPYPVNAAESESNPLLKDIKRLFLKNGDDGESPLTFNVTGARLSSNVELADLNYPFRKKTRKVIPYIIYALERSTAPIPDTIRVRRVML